MKPARSRPRGAPRRFTSVEARIDEAARALLMRLPAQGPWAAGVEFLVFGLKQGWAALYGGALLALLMATALWYPADAALPRYDFLFGCALAIQVLMLVARLEQPAEAWVILIFHLAGTAMEVFKTAAGSWTYPEDSVLRVGAVPLFSGFMYAAVGSYLARVMRIFDMRFEGYPPAWTTFLLAAAVYVNFFAHHFILDGRWLLFGATVLMFRRCTVHYRVFRGRHRMNLLLGWFLVALFIWIAENIATLSRAWLYPDQLDGWVPVSPAKLGSWYLLMIVSFMLVTIVHRPRRVEEPS
jgi:uncharacterized membrane protein YoaT (DUF817 family)